MNAKLSNAGNKAKAWTASPNAGNKAEAWTASPKDLRRVGEEGITWVNETSTMVLGISLSNSIGAHDSYSVIGASATLDDSCMNFAQSVYACTRTEIIDNDTLAGLTKVTF